MILKFLFTIITSCAMIKSIINQEGVVMKATKSVLSVCIALALLLIPVFSVFGGAVSAPETVTRDCPEIYVHGFMASRILYDPAD